MSYHTVREETAALQRSHQHLFSQYQIIQIIIDFNTAPSPASLQVDIVKLKISSFYHLQTLRISGIVSNGYRLPELARKIDPVCGGSRIEDQSRTEIDVQNVGALKLHGCANWYSPGPLSALRFPAYGRMDETYDS